VDSVGNVFVAAESEGDIVTVAYSNAGVPFWTNRYDGPANGRDWPQAIAVNSSGNVFVTGLAEVCQGSEECFDYVTIAYSNSGVPLWTNLYNGPDNGDDAARAIAVDGRGNVFVTGESTSGGFGSPLSDYATVAYSNAGEVLWINRYDGPSNGSDRATAIAVDGTGNVFVTGVSFRSGTGDSDYATIKYSNDGIPIWTNRYNGGASAVAVDSTGNVFVTGGSAAANRLGD